MLRVEAVPAALAAPRPTPRGLKVDLALSPRPAAPHPCSTLEATLFHRLQRAPASLQAAGPGCARLSWAACLLITAYGAASLVSIVCLRGCHPRMSLALPTLIMLRLLPFVGYCAVSAY